MANPAPGPTVAMLDHLNRGSPADFCAALSGVFENSPWIAERAVDKRPFSDIASLHGTMMDTVATAPEHVVIELLRAHPELAGREAIDGVMTEASTGEQGRLGFDRLTAAELERITCINAAYRARFGFPCIVALRLHETRASVLDEMERRLGNDRALEIRLALEQIAHITRGRLDKIMEGR